MSIELLYHEQHKSTAFKLARFKQEKNLPYLYIIYYRINQNVLSDIANISAHSILFYCGKNISHFIGNNICLAVFIKKYYVDAGIKDLCYNIFSLSKYLCTFIFLYKRQKRHKKKLVFDNKMRLVKKKSNREFSTFFVQLLQNL